MTLTVYDDRVCQLGEGPLWHPVRQQLFWFDILAKTLLTKSASGTAEWVFEEEVSAAGWVDAETLLVASASGLWRLNLKTGARQLVCPLEKDNLITRSNDGRADPWGGFWIGTMGRNAEPQAGAIYRYYRGTIQKLFSRITISNAICFASDRSRAYFTDTATGKVMQVALDRNGWPVAQPVVFIDLLPEGLNPDGALVDADNLIWIAQWGASRVAAYNIDGTLQRAISLPAQHVTCPAFGGTDYETLFVTSATQGLSARDIASNPDHGRTFAITGGARGRPEPKVLL